MLQYCPALSQYWEPQAHPFHHSSFSTTSSLHAFQSNHLRPVQAQASAIRSHRFGLRPSDFSSKQAYTAWRKAALAESAAALDAQQRLPEFNALLEVRC